MSFFIRIFDRNFISDIDLYDKRCFSIGSGKKDDFQLNYPGIRPSHIVFQVIAGVWVVKCQKNTYIGKTPFSEKRVCIGDAYILNVSQNLIFVVYQKSDSEKRFDLRKYNSITIGRNPDNAIQFLNNRISGKHIKIFLSDGQYFAEDLNSTNGSYINGKRIKRSLLSNGDTISIGIYDMIFSNGTLFIYNSFDELLFHNEEPQSSSVKEYEYFKRSPRLKLEVPTDEIEIQSPPAIGTKPEINWLTVLLPPLAMICIMVTTVLLTGGSSASLLYTLPMSMITILVAIVNYRSQVKKHRKRERLRLEKYKEHIYDSLNLIQDKTNEQLKAMNMASPRISECVDIVRNVDRRLWERKPYDEDFMTLRIGQGTVNFSCAIKIPKNSISLEEDHLKTKPEEIYEKYSQVKYAPIICPLINFSSCGIIGARPDIITLVKNMVLQAATLHCYTDLKIVTVFNETEKKDFEWIKWLPHSFDEERQKRYMASSKRMASELFKELSETFKQREMEVRQEDSYRSSGIKLPYYLFIISNPELVEGEEICRYLYGSNSTFGVGSLLMFDDISLLPKDCSLIIEAKGRKGVMFNKENIGVKQYFSFDESGFSDYDRFSRTMAPIRVPEVSGNAMLPSTLTFFEGYNAKKPEDFNIDLNWSKNLTYKSMAVPIGVKTSGEAFYFDIHEKMHGPHGLVAGMTGSGKSEMVQSWILSMALKFSPQDVSFVLIDFKGTGLILPFMNMPHLAGTISDLDTNIKRNLIALENELSRRKALLDSVGVNNITAYLKLYKDGKAPEPLSFLFIIIDEFAEFKVQFPDFMTVVNRIFAIGRTLGVFALLLTQKPAGVVDDKMNANTRFRWCLKVASSADSKEMIKHPDAAKITNPGRAYVQVGEDEVFELVQSYWSGAPYNPDSKSKTGNVKISIVELNGKKTSYEAVDPVKKTGNSKNEIDVIVSYLDEYVKEKNIPTARSIWSPKLSDMIPLEDITKDKFDGENWHNTSSELSPVIGMIDDPANQTQYPLRMNFSEDGHIAVYGAPGSGKTTLLQTLVMSLCMTYTPDFVNIYIMDFGGWSMNIFRDFPHVGGIANDNEEEKIDKLSRMISKELASRKKKFAELGIGNINAYKAETGETIPYIVLVLDNFAPVYGLYPELESFFITLTREGANYGIYFTTTCNAVMGLGYKTGQNIKMSLALQMTDKSEYVSIVGKTDGLEPEKNSGRGLVKGNPPLEFQTAIPANNTSESERAKAIKSMALLMSEKWEGNCAKPIPIMPEIITFGSFKSSDVCIGLSIQDIEPINIKPDTPHYTIISGKPESGKTNMLKLIMKQYTSQEKIVYDTTGNAYDSVSNIITGYYSKPEEFDAFLEELVPELQKRMEQFKSGTKAEFEPMLIVIDDIKKCFDSLSDISIQRLNAIVNLGKGLNVILLIAGDCDEISKLYNQGEPFTTGLVKSPVNILLGGSFRDHGVFKSNLHYSEVDKQVGEYEGYIVVKENAVKFKAMYEK